MEVVFKPEYKEAIDKKLEIWTSIGKEGFEPYEISSHGRVRNVARKEKFLKQRLCVEGYAWVSMQRKTAKGYITKERATAVWLAETFLVKPVTDEKLTVDHIDRNRANNDLHNLRWATARQQSLNRRSYTSKSTPINQYEKTGVFIRQWISLKTAVSSDTRFNINTIRGNLNNRSQTAYGYVWKYERNEIVGEEWKIHPDIDVPVSNKGRVKTKYGFATTGNPRDGKDCVTIEGQKYVVARLVAETFYGKHEGEKVIYIDGNRRNNNVENLKFGGITKSYIRPNAKISQDKVHLPSVLQIDSHTKKILAYFDTVETAATKLNIEQNEIQQVCKRELKGRSVGGYKWRYSNHRRYKRKFEDFQHNEKKRKRDLCEEEESDRKRVKHC